MSTAAFNQIDRIRVLHHSSRSVFLVSALVLRVMV